MKSSFLNDPLTLKKYSFPKLLCSFFLLLFVVQPIQAADNKESEPVRKELKFATNFQTVSIEGDVTVVFTNNPVGTITIEGAEKILNKVKYVLADNKLTIDVNQITSLTKITVYLSIITLQNFEMNGNADITSLGVLTSDRLSLYLNGNISVNIKTTGKLKFDYPDNIEITKRSREILKAKAF